MVRLAVKTIEDSQFFGGFKVSMTPRDPDHCDVIVMPQGRCCDAL